MKTFATEEQLINVCRSIQCDRCKRIDDDIFEMQEYFCVAQNVGYGGILGDGNKVRLDLCQYCFKELFEGIYRIEGNYIWDDNTFGEAVANSKMDPQYDYLNELMDEEHVGRSHYELPSDTIERLENESKKTDYSSAES